MAPVMVEVEALTKRFDTTDALACVTLAADRGEVVALLGPNGAGKTTLIRVLTTLVVWSSGIFAVFFTVALGQYHRSGS